MLRLDIDRVSYALYLECFSPYLYFFKYTLLNSWTINMHWKKCIINLKL